MNTFIRLQNESIYLETASNIEDHEAYPFPLFFSGELSHVFQVNTHRFAFAYTVHAYCAWPLPYLALSDFFEFEFEF